MRVDRQGNLLSPARGHLGMGPDGSAAASSAPETAANLTWGDADYQTLYITATSVYKLRTKTRFIPGL
jgi:gluconolactonase